MTFLTARRIRVYSLSIVVLFVLIYGFWMFTGSGLLDRNGQVIGSDFLCYYAVSHELLQGEYATVYDAAFLYEVEQSIVHSSAIGVFPWPYPPVFFFFVYPFATVPYLTALFLWLFITLGAFLLVLHRIIPHPYTLGLALAFPGTIQNFANGQNGFLSAFLLGLGLLALEKRPLRSGILFGFLIYKPHLGLLLLFALIAGRHWVSLRSASLSATFLITLTILFFGTDCWREFFHTLGHYTGYVQTGVSPWHMMPTIFSGARLFGLSITTAHWVQLFCSVSAIAILMWVWRHHRGPLTYVVLIGCIFLTTPYAFQYDLVLLGLAIAWHGRESLQTRWLAGEKAVLFITWLIPAIYIPIAQVSHIEIVPFVLVALLAIALRRLSLTLRP